MAHWSKPLSPKFQVMLIDPYSNCIDYFSRPNWYMLFINLGRFSRAMAASYFKVKRVIREHIIYYSERDVANA